MSGAAKVSEYDFDFIDAVGLAGATVEERQLDRHRRGAVDAGFPEDDSGCAGVVVALRHERQQFDAADPVARRHYTA